MKNLPLLIGTLVFSLLLVAGVAVFFSKPSTPKIIDQKLLYGDSRHVRGPADAKITIVEFSDLQCPACKAAEPLVRQVLQKYPNDVRLIYRQFPLVNVHQHAQFAAKVAEAITDKDKFWQMHDMMFDNQDDWAELPNDDAVLKKFEEYMTKIQIDKNELEKRISAQDVSDRIAQDVGDGTKINIQGTPTFYVNGQETPAPQLLSAVESARTSTK